MNEFELSEKIQKSIHNGNYNELLNDSEKELQAVLSRYEPEDIMILINRIVWCITTIHIEMKREL